MCTTVDSDPATVCDTNHDGRFEELCAVDAHCRSWSSTHVNGGCGTAGVCETPRVTSDTASQTAPLVIGNLSDQTALFTTPSVTPLSTPQVMAVCFTTRQSLQADSNGDYAELADTLTVIELPGLGTGNGTRFHVTQNTVLAATDIRALENSSPQPLSSRRCTI